MRKPSFLFLLMLLLANRTAAQTSPAYAVYGPSGIDMAGCSQAGPIGTLASNFWVLRRHDVTGPTHVAITNLPPDVTATVSPEDLTYPGWVTGQQVTISFTVNAGVAIPDVVVNLTVSDAMNSVTNELLLYNTCPRHNRDFTIRGWFSSVHETVAFPVEGALVEIYREIPWQFDQRVGSTITGPDGTFQVRLWADDEDTYYAKLRLNDVAGVYMHEWWNPGIKDYNSVNRGSNSQPVIDLFGTVITRDGGNGTPKSAAWQGGRAAYQEFIRTFSAPPPTGDYEIVNQNTVTGMTWTARSTTNWEEGTATEKYSNTTPVAPGMAGFDPYFSQLVNYSTNFHEFGHALRHTIDGDQRHFTDDATRWTYARGHGLCGSDAGYIEIEAFAFNEGWAEFWAMDTGDDFTGNCSASLNDMTIEGAVMNDLHLVGQAIAACQPAIADPAERARARRRNLYTVLNRGGNIIHSQGEFRSNASQQFAGCPLLNIGVGVAAHPLTSTTGRQVRPSDIARFLPQRIGFLHSEVSRLTQERATARSAARELRDCRTIPCEVFVQRMIRPVILDGHLRYLSLVGRAFERRYREQREKGERPTQPSLEELDRQQESMEDFRREALKIVLGTLGSGANLLDRYADGDTTGFVRASAADLRRTARRLQLRAPRNDELFTFFEIATMPEDDRTSAARRE
jgi:hypothetical protein